MCCNTIHSLSLFETRSLTQIARVVIGFNIAELQAFLRFRKGVQICPIQIRSILRSK